MKDKILKHKKYRKAMKGKEFKKDEFVDTFEQDGYLWGFKQGDVIPSAIRSLRRKSLLQQFMFASGAIATFIIFAAGAIAWSVFVPGRERILTQKYNFQTRQLEQAYISYHKPFLLSGTAVLWCNGELKTFDSTGAVITTNASFNGSDSIIDCR